MCDKRESLKNSGVSKLIFIKRSCITPICSLFFFIKEPPTPQFTPKIERKKYCTLLPYGEKSHDIKIEIM
jgi:hypothetical protein